MLITQICLVRSKIAIAAHNIMYSWNIVRDIIQNRNHETS